MTQEFGVATAMAVILGTMLAMVGGLVALQDPKKDKDKIQPGRYYPCPITEPSRLAYEKFVSVYSPMWMCFFGLVVVTQVYEQFTAWSYLQVCGGFSLPFLLQPVLFPSAGFNSPDAKRPLLERYSFKANVWIAVYSFIGNYWYTHYFYSVLKAQYTMPAHRLNNVPIAMYFATHFYFSSYHLFSNLLLRKIVTSYQEGIKRTILFVAVVLVFSYFTAFMETLTISSFPYYSFEDRDMAYTVGSAFYGIYFIVSFPGFYYFDADVDKPNNSAGKVTWFDTILSSCGHGMMIMTLLDFVRLSLDIPLVVGAPPLAS
ncbi:Cycloeucalenol [Seminavis robusta]|uniref:Cycloeucalenol n=1 Tax=Seminavis robusta TaxID=568900 RepID=A0A9N8ECU1_9STRA|nr:Cycloeucalenol [Seminavis robusta]|eukprot:Sro810_g205760.1 Cycloeucalenol (315) ;mRNA; r:24205-25260